jgi:hypothetical protein
MKQEKGAHEYGGLRHAPGIAITVADGWIIAAYDGRDDLDTSRPVVGIGDRFFDEPRPKAGGSWPIEARHWAAR